MATSATLYRRMLSARGSALFAASMRDRLAAELAQSFNGGSRPIGFDDVPAEVHAAYLAGALSGVIAQWVAGDHPASAEEVALWVWRLSRA